MAAKNPKNKGQYFIDRYFADSQTIKSRSNPTNKNGNYSNMVSDISTLFMKSFTDYCPNKENKDNIWRFQPYVKQAIKATDYDYSKSLTCDMSENMYAMLELSILCSVPNDMTKLKVVLEDILKATNVLLHGKKYDMDTAMGYSIRFLAFANVLSR